MNLPQPFKDILKKNNLSDYQVTFLQHDASPRRYARISKEKKSFIIMWSPSSGNITQNNPTRLANNSLQRFIKLANWLSDKGFLVPQIIDCDLENDLAIISDLGGTSFRTHMQIKHGFSNAYQNLLTCLVELSKINTCDLAPDDPIFGLPEYNNDVFINEIKIMHEWFVEKKFKTKIDKSIYKETISLWEDCLKKLPTPSCLVLRDVHADNILLSNIKDNKNPKSHIGFIDFQDALKGHDAYDVVSFNQDVRTPYNPEIEQEAINFYCDLSKKQSSDLSFDKHLFLERYHILGAQRSAKILGVFSRLALRENNSSYQQYMKNCWNVFNNNLDKHHILKPLKKHLREQYTFLWDYYGK